MINVYQLMEEAVSEYEKHYWQVISYRGVEYPCHKCNGLGCITYGSTATWQGGIGGQALTDGVCDHCWGSGDENRKWADLKALKNKLAGDKK
jgi:hypothetical protein